MFICTEVILESPIGLIEVTATETELVSVLFVDEKQQSLENEIIHHYLHEIDAYFKGNLQTIHHTSNERHRFSKWSLDRAHPHPIWRIG